jgi:uncharacterized protein YyaL (SSP411 family)
MANRLANETSPYLLQHAHNPVDWYPWGDEAFARARAEDKPVLLSVGYSACHWCHVMERESFENAAIARLMNEHFVSIKVDREERPDVDAVYMNAVQALTGHGGWPMTVFLTPDGRPFYGGTYFPPEDRHNMPGFPRVLTGMAKAYREQRGQIDQRAEQITEHLRRALPAGQERGDLVPELLDQAARALWQNFDPQQGGFGGAPKFPAAMALDFLLRHWKRTGDVGAHGHAPLHIVEFSLEKMARGGIYDHLGGGFHRYAVDAIWLVPHFEKMLYDNALLARAYLHAFQATGKPLYRRVVEETLDYVLREMTDPSGGFYSTQDADSEGEEGKFFVWTPVEVEAVLGAEAARAFNAYYAVTEHGNFEHTNVLSVPRSLDDVAAGLATAPDDLESSLAGSRRRLFEARERRVHPGRDDKVLTAWNGMMLRTMAEAAAVLDRDDYRAAAVRNAGFLTHELVRDGRVLRSWKDGQAKIDGYLEDYALLIDGLLYVHELTFDPGWIEAARGLAERMLDLFWDEEEPGFYDTARDAGALGRAPLPVRPRDPLDNATPSGTSVAASVLLRLAIILGREDFARRAAAVLASQHEAMVRYPSAFGEALQALDLYLSTPPEIAVVGPPDAPETHALLREVHRRYLPNKVLLGRAPADERLAALSPLMEARGMVNGRPTAYVCESYACQAPTNDPAELGRQLGSET